jgi:hypothetical protein
MIGSIAEFVVGGDFSLFAVLQIGGFLGLNTYLVAVPFKVLVFDGQSRRILLLGATRKALREFPQFHFAG